MAFVEGFEESGRTLFAVAFLCSVIIEAIYALIIKNSFG
jgi:hypothetical protein